MEKQTRTTKSHTHATSSKGEQLSSKTEIIITTEKTYLKVLENIGPNKDLRPLLSTQNTTPQEPFRTMTKYYIFYLSCDICNYLI